VSRVPPESQVRGSSSDELTRQPPWVLTNEEYTLEILKRGRYLQAIEKKRIAEIKSGRVHDLVE
jgi:hypothetical protein